MKSTFYILFRIKRRGNSPSAFRVTQEMPVRQQNEFAVKATLDFPNGLTQEFLPEVDIKVSTDDLLKPNLNVVIEHASEDVLIRISDMVADKLKSVGVHHDS